VGLTADIGQFVHQIRERSLQDDLLQTIQAGFIDCAAHALRRLGSLLTLSDARMLISLLALGNHGD
jgi:hypothetical protein